MAVYAADDTTGHDEFLVNVEPCRGGIYDLHESFLSVTGQGLQRYKTVLYVLRTRRRQGVVPAETQVTVLTGSRRRQDPTLCPIDHPPVRACLDCG